MKALVTGATGLVGRAIVDALLAQGHSVQALVRPTARVDDLMLRGVNLIIGDLNNEESLRQATRGVDVVFHCAALLGFGASEADMEWVNVVGTELVLVASRAARVRRFVHLSSVAVYGPHEPPIHEDAALQPTSIYGRTKLAAEEAVWQAGREGLPVTVLRPSVIYGPGDRYFLPALLKVMRLPVIPLPDDGDTLVELVYVSDVADAALLAASRQAAIGQAYNLTDGRSTTLRDVVETFGLLTGYAPRIVDISAERLQYIASLAHEALAPVNPRLAYVLGSNMVANLGRDTHYDLRKAERDLGYAPRVGLYEGLRRALVADAPGVLRGGNPNFPLAIGGLLVLAGLVGGVLLRRAFRRPRRAAMN